MKTVLFCFGLMLACATAAYAGVYKWVDQDGNVHFTDTPPPKQPTEEVRIQKAPTPAAQTADAGTSSPPDAGDDPAESESDRKICLDAIRNLRRFAPMWERKIRAKMPDMSAEERAKAESAIDQMNDNMGRLKTGLGQCVQEMKNASHRSKTECMANAPDDTTAMFCVM